MHRLTAVDPDSRTAVCEACGPVKIRVKITRADGSIQWRCSMGDKRDALARGTWKRGKDRTHGRRHNYRHVKGDTCERCGFVAEHRAQMDVHHRDGNHSNDALENLGTLCSNCHRFVHLA